MAKKGIRTASLLVNNGSVVVYYSLGTTMRFPTDVRINKKKRDGKFVEWDYKHNTIQSNLADFYTQDAIIQNVLKRANDILEENAREGTFLTGEELEKILTTEKEGRQIVRSAMFKEMYDQFYEQKKREFGINGSMSSLKDYTSFKNVIIDFEKVHSKKIKIKDIDESLIKEIHYWLISKLPKNVETPEGLHELKVRGNLKPKSLRKRFDTLKEFLRFLQRQKLITDIEFLKEYVKRSVPNVKITKETLTVDEVFKFYDYDFKNDRLNNIKQLFTFACLTGMRWGDLVNFDFRFVKKTNEKYVYKRTAKKTANSSGADIEIPLCATVMQILNRNGKTLKPLLISNMKANEYVKEALKITGYFDDVTEQIDKETGENKRRYEAISMHKGRDTFITNLVNVTPLNELMKYTGHTKLSTLQGYIDNTRSVSHDYIDKTFIRKTKRK